MDGSGSRDSSPERPPGPGAPVIVTNESVATVRALIHSAGRARPDDLPAARQEMLNLVGAEALQGPIAAPPPAAEDYQGQLGDIQIEELEETLVQDRDQKSWAEQVSEALDVHLPSPSSCSVGAPPYDEELDEEYSARPPRGEEARAPQMDALRELFSTLYDALKDGLDRIMVEVHHARGQLTSRCSRTSGSSEMSRNGC